MLCLWSYSVIHSILTPPYIFQQNTPSKLSIYWGITFTGKRKINLQTYHYFCQRNIELNRQICFLLSAWIFILPEQSVELRFLISGKIYFLIGERRTGHCIWEEVWRNENKHLLERGLHPGKHNDTQDYDCTVTVMGYSVRANIIARKRISWTPTQIHFSF